MIKTWVEGEELLTMNQITIERVTGDKMREKERERETREGDGTHPQLSINRSSSTILWACWVFPFVMWEQEDMMTSLHKKV